MFLDENAAINILVVGGQSETKKRTEPAPPKGARERGARNGRGGKCNPPPSPPGRGARGVGAAACETSTHRGVTAR
ncbi:hypothetical protein [Okeania sp. SIO3B5]|uniref:hypothetical protein n=1 Tax=Okeania sp. SIO3B5 TaxID=2607811 RepID=UPI0025E6B215|nr:hypothetical protein [Okeania sp. SIO3B5]